MNKSFLVAAVAALALTSAASAAVVVPFTENFVGSNAGWTGSPATYVADGGPNGAGDGYITSLVANLPAANGSSFSIFARANIAANASGGAFAGDYSGIYQISFYVRQNYSAADLTMGIRLGGATPGTAMSIILPTPVAANVWTDESVFLYPGSPNIISYEGTPGATTAIQFANATANVANLQVFDFGTTPPGAVTGANVTFDLDAVSVAVPEPTSTVGLLAALPLLARRRRA